MQRRTKAEKRSSKSAKKQSYAKSGKSTVPPYGHYGSFSLSYGIDENVSSSFDGIPWPIEVSTTIIAEEEATSAVAEDDRVSSTAAPQSPPSKTTTKDDGDDKGNASSRPAKDIPYTLFDTELGASYADSNSMKSSSQQNSNHAISSDDYGWSKVGITFAAALVFIFVLTRVNNRRHRRRGGHYLDGEVSDLEANVTGGVAMQLDGDDDGDDGSSIWSAADQEAFVGDVHCDDIVPYDDDDDGLSQQEQEDPEIQSPPRTAVMSGAVTTGMTIQIDSPNSIQTEDGDLQYDFATPARENVRDPYPQWWCIGSL